jgi:hypothetical protein
VASSETALFESLALRSLAEAIRRRRKAIRHKADHFALERGVDRRDGVAFERLDLSLTRLRRDFHFTFWEDALAWISVRQVHPKKGVIVNIGFHTEIWDVPANVVVARLESTILKNSDETIRPLWIPPAAQSPSKKMTR